MAKALLRITLPDHAQAQATTDQLRLRSRASRAADREPTAAALNRGRLCRRW
jgi:hypothetical protein